ncbi:hypothetical protein B0H11DRAFT_2276322 [Mycena galericulata]|nr:hypothetical protein B0H11DRAFT_2276322 [Mycena galericulata]
MSYNTTGSAPLLEGRRKSKLTCRSPRCFRPPFFFFRTKLVSMARKREVVESVTWLVMAVESFTLPFIRLTLMAKKTNVSTVLLPNSDSDNDDTEQDGSQPKRVELLPEQHVRRGADGHMRHDFTLVRAPASPVKARAAPLLLPDVAPVGSYEWDTRWGGGGVVGGEEEGPPVYDLAGTERDPEEHGPIRKEPRALRASDNPIGLWVAKKKPQLYLDQLVLLDGCGDYQVYDECIGCGARAPTYRCRQCFTDDLYCKPCIVGVHADSPLHHVEVWMEGMFERTTLKSLGLRIQLGHGKPGKVRRGRCILPSPAVDDDFVVVASNGIHEVALDFCNCSTAQAHNIQLLRARWYPATGKIPRTAATFEVLRRFHHMTLQSKCSGAEFYNSLVRETDNSGTETVRDRYDEFLRMTREWRHLQMLKRAGRGHDSSGVEGTKPGECALLCPACPQPGKNLPPGWKNAPKEKRYLYALFLALDANFRMRRKKVSSEEKDPSLGDGWSFYGKISPYYEYLAKYWHVKQERSTCVAHDAVDKPDRESRGTASSGIATVDCARHNMKRPNAVGDLQLGERYINMDYIFFMGLAGSEVSELYVSYDIACQWHKNIWERMKTFDEGVRFHRGRKYTVFLIPKFHLPAHIEACNILFSFHLTRYVGMTDGEAPERGWAHLNPLATSTTEMGPGNRRDTINDVFNDWNHTKIIKLGGWAMKKISECVPELITCSVELEELEESLRNLGASEALEEWRKEVEAWEENADNPNPFESRVKIQTVLDVRREMAEEVEREMEEDMLEGLQISDEMHATEMIGMGLQLEELQRNLAFDMASVGNHPTSDQQTNMIERSNKLRRKLLTWMDAQVTFVPHVALLRAEEDRARTRISATQAQPGILVQHMTLWMPSTIKGRVECDDELYQYEFRLRKAQANEALEETKIEGVEERVRRGAERYRAARRALVGLAHQVEDHSWEVMLRPLLLEDVRGMPRALFQDPERKKLLMKKGPEARRRAAEKGAEAKARMSWIWRAPGAEEAEGGAKGLNYC